ncbi:MAG: N-acetylneuraminate synthase [Bacteroidetes bacterium]|nr:N-acetylneuraminate synthase [Bacteroidota bacterium]
MKTVEISGHLVGPGQPCFIIAEAGVNHNGHLDLALKLVDAAAEAGVDAVKFQTFLAEKIIAPTAPKAEYQVRSTGETESQLQMVKRLELTHLEFRTIAQYCKTKDIIFLSTPFEEASADFLETIGLSAFKMASGEITNLPFQAHVARKGKPMIVSTGMSSLDEVNLAVRAIRAQGNPDLILLHCTSNYPTNPQEVNLKAMQTLADMFDIPVGYSDHTEGVEITLAAVALGACVLEKHFTLDPTLPGPDQQASLEVGQLKALVQGIRKIEAALGSGIKEPVFSEASTAAAARKSLHLKNDLPAGAYLRSEDLLIMRPGTGISPARLEKTLGRQIKKPMRAGSILQEEDLV